MALRKPSDLFGNKSEDHNIPVIESDNSLHEELNKVESLSEQISQLQQELSQKIVQTDLEKLVLSQINSMQENFEYLQNDFRKSNKKDIAEFKDKVSELTEIVGNLVENELPKFKKQFTKNQIDIGEKFNEFKEVVEENISSIKEDVDTQVNNIAEVIDNNLEYFNNQLQETSSEVKKTTETYNKLSKIVESKVSKENEKLEEYSQVIQSLYESFVELEASLQEETSTHRQVVEGFIEEKFESISSNVKSKIDNINEKVGNIKDKVSTEISNIKADVVINEQHLKKVENYIQENHQELVTLRDEVFVEIEKLPVGNLQENLDRLEKKIDYIKETYSRIEPEVIVKEVIREGLTNIPPEEKTSDPLSPINQNFVTLDQLQEHYRLFINRIQQQLSTLGGGGETRLEFLDDVDRNSAKVNGRFLKYDAASGKWIGALGGGGGSQTLDDTLGLGNTSSLGMSVGISTFNNVTVGGVTTSLVVNGDARITGILTIGTASLTLDGKNNLIKIGTGITLSESGSANYSGIITASAFVGDGSLLTNLPGGSGIATYADSSGIATYADSSGIATYADSSGIATYADSSGIATYATSSGIATYATSSGISISLQNSRTFEITGDIIASPISFDGTGNVSLAATIQPNSVALGSDTTGDYVQSISGTSNQITVTSGTGESSSPVLSLPSNLVLPQDVTVTRDLQVNRNLNVTGNITLGGTTAFINVQELVVSDPDIILGYRTDAFGNDASNDNTANHGGVAIASTEGTPLVDLFIVGIETTPATYKKIMWFKEGTFAGLGTDAWLSNYAVGIGSTQFPTGTRLAAGSVQFTENDLAVVRNINAVGIITASSFSGNASSATYATSSGIATYADSSGIATYASTAGIATYADSSGLSTSVIGGIGSITSLSVSGISTLGVVTTGNIYSTGIVTATSFVKFGGTPTQFLKADGSSDSNTYLGTTGSGTNLTGIVTSIVAGTNITISGSTGQVTINSPTYLPTRVNTAGATSGSLTPNGDTTDLFISEGLTGAITINAPSGTPLDGQKLMIRLKDDGTARGITWTTSSGAYRAIGVTLPTTTVLGKVTYIGCIYNGTDLFWDAVATVTQV